ncbi:MAG: glycosyltransferase family 4 protein [Gemmatimonadaceae bacterium]
MSPSPARKAIRVLIVGPSLDIVGGQAVQAKRLIEELKKVPDLEIVFQPVNPRLPGPLGFLQRIKYVRTIVTEAVYLTRLLLRAPRYDVLHVFSAGYSSFLIAAAPALIVAKLLGKKSVLNYRDGRAYDHLSTRPSAVRIIRLATKIVAPSGFLVGEFAKFQLPATFIYNIIDSDLYQYRNRGKPKPRFFHNRGMESHYNVPCTLRAFAIVQQRYPEATLTLAHDGSLRSQLEQMVAEMQLKNVSFVGTVSQKEMRALYDAAEIYLMSPDIDNMPGSILECYICGLPFVSTNVGGIPLIVDNGRTGLLVGRDDHAAMAEAAIRLLEDDNLAITTTRNGRLECAKYQGANIAANWHDLYRQLVSP